MHGFVLGCSLRESRRWECHAAIYTTKNYDAATVISMWDHKDVLCPLITDVRLSVFYAGVSVLFYCWGEPLPPYKVSRPLWAYSVVAISGVKGAITRNTGLY